MFEGHRWQLRQSIGSEVVRPRAQLHEPYLLTLAGITRIRLTNASKNNTLPSTNNAATGTGTSDAASSHLHLALSKPILAYVLTNSPAGMLAIFDEVALTAILVYYPRYEPHSLSWLSISSNPNRLICYDLAIDYYRETFPQSTVSFAPLIPQLTFLFILAACPRRRFGVGTDERTAQG
jgi:hypothetical protein